MGQVDRRSFLKRVGAAGALGGAAVLGGRELVTASPGHDMAGDHALHGGHGTVGTVDHARNGFTPMELLTDFDTGTVSRDSSGRRVREYEFITINKEIEIAPGVFFPAWTYNGRVPGPTIRATEGDRLRISLVNASDHPHTMHF